MIHAFLRPCVILLVLGSTSLAGSQDELEVRPYDIVVTKDGKEWVGVIIEETEAKITIDLRSGGTYTVDRFQEVSEVRRSNPPDKVYERRRRRAGSSDVEAHWELAKWCLSDPDWGLESEAVRHLEIVNRVEPRRAEVYPLLLDLYERVPDSAKTIERRDAEIGTCIRGLENGIELASLAIRTARHLEFLGDPIGALQYLEKARELGLEEELRGSVENDIARLLEVTGQRERAKAFVSEIGRESESRALELLLLSARWLLEGVAAGDEGARAELEAVCASILDRDERQQQAHLFLACSRFLEGKWSAAQESFQKALRGNPNDELTLAYALFFAAKGDTTPATALLKSLQGKIESDGVESWVREQYQLIRALMFENDQSFADALDAARSAISGDSRTWQGSLVYLHTASRLGDDAVFESEKRRYLELFSQNPVAFAEIALLIGTRAFDLREGEEARRWLAYAAEVFEDDFEVLLRLGLSHLLPGGSLKIAREALEAAQAERPASIDCRNALGCLEYRSGRFELAKRWFRGVAEEYSDQRENDEPLPTEALYATRGLRQVDAVQNEEVWRDSFDRPDGEVVLNNWQSDNRFGVRIEQEDGRAVFAGVQKFEANGLTQLVRAIPTDRLSRFRAELRLAESSPDVRVGLRIENRDGSEGLVFYRDIDGVLAFATYSGGGDSEVFRPVPVDQRTEDYEDEHELQYVRWGDDTETHTMTVRFDPDTQEAELYFDGVRIAQEIRVPFRVSGGGVLGVSGQAELGGRYRLEVDDFEIFQRRLEVRSRERR